MVKNILQFLCAVWLAWTFLVLFDMTYQHGRESAFKDAETVQLTCRKMKVVQGLKNKIYMCIE